MKTTEKKKRAGVKRRKVVRKKRPARAAARAKETSPLDVIDVSDFEVLDVTVESEDEEEETPPAVPEERKPRSQRDVVPYDPLRAYLREIKKYTPLTREEEHDLAVRYKDEKDLQAAYQLVSANLWLVVKIAREYERAARSLLDLIQEGNIGLMEAVKNFDPYRGVRLPSYAVFWIKAYIIRHVIANWRIVKIGTTQAQRKLFFNLQKEKEKLERAGFYPGPKLLAEKLDVKESEVIEMEKRLGAPDVSVDAPVSGEGDVPLLALLPSHEHTAEELVSYKQIQALIQEGFMLFVATLNEKEEAIFQKRMISEDKATLQDLSEELGISRERVRQIENRTREKLKEFLIGKYGKGIENLQF